MTSANLLKERATTAPRTLLARELRRLSAPTPFVLPTPPTDDEKHLYSARQLSVLMVSSMLSLTCLTISQLHLIHLTAWL